MRHSLARLIVRGAAWLAPWPDRGRWREEWLAELEAGSHSVLRRALGAPRDALALRRERRARLDTRRGPSTLLPSHTDVVLAWRVLRRTPFVTAASILALAVGLGLTVVGFTIVRAVFYQDLPGPDGARVVRISDLDREGRRTVDVTVDEFRRRRGAVTVLDDLGAYHERQVRWGDDDRARVITAAYVTPNAMALIGVRPVAGRDLAEDDSLPAGAEVVLVREPLAVEQFGSTAEAVGRPVVVDGRRRTIVGLIEASCRFPFISDVWIPVASVVGEGPVPERSLGLFGRLAPGVTVLRAAAEMTAIANADPERRDQVRSVSRVAPFGRPPGPPEQQLAGWAFVAALGLVLLVATANVAHLVVARAAARRNDLAVRAALGASRLRLAAQFGMEGLALGLLAAAAGTAGAAVALRWLRTTIPDLPYWVRFDLDVGSTAVMAALAVAVSLAIGMAPAVHVTGRPSGLDLTRTGPTLRLGRLSSVLIAAEIAVAVGLLYGAVHVGQALVRFGAHEYRLPAAEVLVAQIDYGSPPATRTPEYNRLPAGQRREVWSAHEAAAELRQRELVAHLRLQPEVERVSRASHYPGNEPRSRRFEIETVGTEPPGAITTRIVEADDELFAVLDAPALAGRTFTAHDVRTGSAVAVVNEPFVVKHLGARAAVGRRIRELGTDGRQGPWREIIGVVRDLGLNPGAPSLADGVYVPIAPTSLIRVALRSRRPAPLGVRLHELAASGEPAATVQWTTTLAEQLDNAVVLYRGLGYALTSLGLVALLLACTGIHALVSLSVSERRRELAIRLALGARSGQLVRAVLSRTGWQLGLGSAAGAVVALGVQQAVALTPFDIDAGGPIVVAFSAGVLGAAGLAACLRPLRQALALRPIDWLRS